MEFCPGRLKIGLKLIFNFANFENSGRASGGQFLPGAVLKPDIRLNGNHNTAGSVGLPRPE